jgi:hypothetical protein
MVSDEMQRLFRTVSEKPGPYTVGRAVVPGAMTIRAARPLALRRPTSRFAGNAHLNGRAPASTRH